MADAHLYGVRAPKNKIKEISSSTSLAFSSHLSSLISKSGTSNSSETSNTTSTAQSRASYSKPDIFSTHNRNSRKRALADLEQEDIASSLPQKHKTEQDLGGSLDSNELHRSRRKMEEKARLYAAMKRGDYVPPGDGRGRGDLATGLVDFDRKWAEQNTGGEDGHNTSSGDDTADSDNEKPGDEEVVDYTDEFGRQRKMTRSQIAREEQRKRVQSNFAQEAESMSARPAMPEKGVIYGDTVQHAAFNPDEDTATKMAELAEKRDREATPPEETHYDATSEVRTKGTGFYAFSADQEGRKGEMEALERERRETERKRRERAREKDDRRRMIEQRKTLLREKKGEKMADRFLEGLDVEIGGSGKGEDEHGPED